MGSLTEIINNKENKTRKPGGYRKGSTVMLPIELLVPNSDNKKAFGNREERNIEIFADELLISKKVLQNLVVRKQEDGKFLILSGHRRYYASKLNVERGHREFGELPCEVTEESDAMSYFNLLITNLSAEPLTEHEMMTATMHLKDILPEVVGDDELKGRALRKKISETLKISQTKVAQYENISNNLTGDAMKKFEEQKINVSTANELAGLPDDAQNEFLRDGGTPTYSDVRAVKDDLSVVRSYAQVRETSGRDIALMFDDVFVNTKMKDYLDSICKIVSTKDGTPAFELSECASVVIDMILHYNRSRQFVGKQSSMDIFRNNRIVTSRYSGGNARQITFSHAGFLDCFRNIYQDRIREICEDGGESGEQVDMSDYPEEDPYEQIIPQPDSCDRKCFNCRNDECENNHGKREKCTYFNQLTCTTSEVYALLKKDFPEIYKQCTGCCMMCPAAEKCGYACNRKDMKIIRERAGVTEDTESDNEQIANKDVFVVSKQEEFEAFKSLMTEKNQKLIYIFFSEQTGINFNQDEVGELLDVLQSSREPEADELSRHPCWIKSEYMGNSKYRVTYAYRTLDNTQEMLYDRYTVGEIIRRAVVGEYFGDDENLKYLKKIPSEEKMESFVDDYRSWRRWFTVAEIGAECYRVLIEDGSQIVAMEYAGHEKKNPAVVYYYISKYSRVDECFCNHQVTKDSLIDALQAVAEE